MTPTVPFDPYPAPGPYPTEMEGRALNWSNVGSFTIPFNLSWHPAATVRVGLSRAGLPMGMQLVAPRHRDDLALQAARGLRARAALAPALAARLVSRRRGLAGARRFDTRGAGRRPAHLNRETDA